MRVLVPIFVLVFTSMSVIAHADSCQYIQTSVNQMVELDKKAAIGYRQADKEREQLLWFTRLSVPVDSMILADEISNDCEVSTVQLGGWDFGTFAEFPRQTILNTVENAFDQKLECYKKEEQKIWKDYKNYSLLKKVAMGERYGVRMGLALGRRNIYQLFTDYTYVTLNLIREKFPECSIPQSFLSGH